jgi:hypothetical protein
MSKKETVNAKEKTPFFADIACFYKNFFRQFLYIFRTHIAFIGIASLCAYAVLRTLLNASIVSALMAPARILFGYFVEGSTPPSIVWLIVSVFLTLLGIFLFCLAVTFIRNIFTTINMLNRDNKEIVYKDVMHYARERLNQTFITSFCSFIFRGIALALILLLAYRYASPYLYFADTKIMLFGETKYISSQFVSRFALVSSVGLLLHIFLSLLLSFSTQLTLFYDMHALSAIRHSITLALRAPLRIFVVQLTGSILSIVLFGLIALMLSASIVGLALLPYVIILRATVKYVFTAQLFLYYNYNNDVLLAYDSKYYTYHVNLYKISF